MNKNLLKNLIVLCLLICFQLNNYSQTLRLDATFNTTDIKGFTFYNNIDRAYGCAIQPTLST